MTESKARHILKLKFKRQLALYLYGGIHETILASYDPRRIDSRRRGRHFRATHIETAHRRHRHRR
ncbi:hypothetical protein TRIP_E370023 [uncultured Spirochaetota bacterium]|uniref:Uncharacterized protein n=1 Tax=uncultured Spirochaetota bacterium TaxID=460511 RepID=A0A652ZYE3_9SPIR|nr:hypothetical protein TRIP_E370023 [uncultured Spirochaetota bacterium]